MDRTERTKKSSGRDLLLVILGITFGIFITRSWYERPREERPAPLLETVEQAEPEAEPEAGPAAVVRTVQGLILPREGLPRSAGRPLQRVEKIEQEIHVSAPALPKPGDEESLEPDMDHNERYGVESFTFRMAMLPPRGSSFVNMMEAFADEIFEESGGRVRFKFYPGGVMGVDPDYIKRMKMGFIAGACFSGLGLGGIVPQARVPEMPFTFKDSDEAAHVRRRVIPMIEELFENKEYTILGWIDKGTTYFFSHDPIFTVGDIKRHKCWVRAGDRLAESLFDAIGLSPIAIPEPDVLLSLQSGLLNAVYASPSRLLQEEWFTKVRYKVEIPLNDPIGAVLLTRRSFDRLSPDLQALMKQTLAKHLKGFNETVQQENQEALGVLYADHGIQRTVPDEDVRRQFAYVGEEVRMQNLGVLWDEEILSTAMSALHAYRLEGQN